MLIACEKCHRQFDVGSMQKGEKLRCLCGELMTVPHRRSHVAKTLHCDSCGGKLRDKASQCEYCGCEITLEERNLGVACPECFARLMKGARYCRECGVEIRPTAIQAKRVSSRCPRCKGELLECTVDQGQYTECTRCGGLWLPEDFFHRVVEKKDVAWLGKVVPETTAGTSKPLREVSSRDVRYLPCPVCGHFMHRKNFASCSGVIIDWCKGHGFWFDTHELERIIEFVNSGGMDRARQHELARAKAELRRIERHRKAVERGNRGQGTITIPMSGRDGFGRPSGTAPLVALIGFLGAAVSSLFED